MVSMAILPLSGCGSSTGTQSPSVISTTKVEPAARLLVSSPSADPGQRLTLTLSDGASFAAAPETRIVFSDGRNYRLALLPLSVAPGAIEVLVPPYINPELAGATLLQGGPVSVSVEQGSAGTLGPASLIIRELPETGVTPGVVTAELVTLLGSEPNKADELFQRIASISGGQIDTSTFASDMEELRTFFADASQQLQPLLDGSQNEVTLQTPDGPIVITTEDLALIDKLLYAQFGLAEQPSLRARGTLEERAAVREALLLSLENNILINAGIVLSFSGLLVAAVGSGALLTGPAGLLGVLGVAVFYVGLRQRIELIVDAINEANRTKRREDWARVRALSNIWIGLNEFNLDLSPFRQQKAVRAQGILDTLGELISRLLAALRNLIAAIDQFLELLEAVPVAQPDSYSTRLNQSLQVAVGSGLLQNDELNGGVLEPFSSATQNGGNVNVAADGSFSYTPPDFFFGSDTFIYRLDGETGVSSATVTIQVQPTLTGVWSEQGTVTAPGQCAGISDTAVMVLQETNGVVNGTLTYSAGGFTDPISGSYDSQTRQLVLVTGTFNSVLIGTVSPNLRSVSGAFTNGLHCLDQDQEGNVLDLGPTSGTWGASR